MTTVSAQEQTMSQEFTATELVGSLIGLDSMDGEFEIITLDPVEDLTRAYGIGPAGPQASRCCCCCLCACACL
jgi:hypothetical protein